MPEQLPVRSCIEAVDRYLADTYLQIPGMSSRFAAGICCGLLKIQKKLGPSGPIAEIGTFQGRFFIALALALEPGERALGIDLFTWPNPQVLDRFEANCARNGIGPDRKITWQTDSSLLTPDDFLAKLDGQQVRFFHIDGEHTRVALTRDLELATSVLAPGGLVVLDDMLHPGYPTLVLAVYEYLERHPEMTVLCIIDRETLTAASKFVLCEKAWFRRYEARMLEVYKNSIWPMGANFEPHWCLVLSTDTTLPAIE